MIAIANPTDLLMDRPPFPRLELPNNTWKAALLELVAGASLIVIAVSRATEGVLAELRTIEWLHQHEHTAVILTTVEDDPTVDSVRQYYGIAPPPRAALEDLVPQLANFPIVLNDDEVARNDEGYTHALAPLFKYVEFLRSLAAEQRVRRKQIVEMNIALRDNLARPPLDDEVVSRLEQAIVGYDAVLDDKLRLSVHSQLAVAYHRQGRLAEAVQGFSIACQVARETGRSSEAGMFWRDIGHCHKAARAWPEAIASYAKACELLERSPERNAALRSLAEAHGEANDTDNAIACYKRAIQGYTEAGDASEAMVTQMGIGVLYFRAERYQDASEAFAEALRAAREMNVAEIAEHAQGMMALCSRAAGRRS
jgi:tetratricopeptide (TPR) repeat protein